MMIPTSERRALPSVRRAIILCPAALLASILMLLIPPVIVTAMAQGDDLSYQQGETAPEDEYMEQEAPLEDEEFTYDLADPLEGWNRKVHGFNDWLYFKIMKPVALGYSRVAPKRVRQCVQNFFVNLRFPVRFINDLLQLKLEKSQRDAFSFIVNTSMGVGGLFNAASSFETLSSPYPEDGGQTLANWGMGDGIYIVWPFFGPSTLKDTLGLTVDYCLEPVSWIEPLYASFGARGLDEINRTSLTIGEYERLKEAAFDPYLALKDAYLQHRGAVEAK